MNSFGKFNRGNVFALLIIMLGIVFLLNLFGILTGYIASYFVPLGMIGVGLFGMKSGRTLLGLVIGGMGALILLGKLAPWLIGIAAAAGIIGYGVSILRKKAGRKRT